MTKSSPIPFISHIVGEPQVGGGQRCILCGATVAPHFLGALPAGRVFEREGRLFLIDPEEDTISCLERHP